MHYFDRGHLPRFGDIGKGSPELARSFFAWYGLATGPGALPVATKCLIGLAVAHALPCVYCIEAYTSNCLENGQDLEQMTEAVQVAAAVKAMSTMTHALQMLQHVQAASMGSGAQAVPIAYYDRQQPGTIAELNSVTAATSAAFDDWTSHVFAADALAALDKQLIAVGVAHVLQCPYSIERHTAAALKLGAGLPQLTEAVQVAAAIRGGAALVTGVQMVDQVLGSTMGPA
jgi:alkylhydroperoxidase/carboxymuconolactone decarboxylase family protein